MNTIHAWKYFNVTMGRNTQQRVKCPDPVMFVNEVNTFYARFDGKDFRNKCDDLCQSLDPLPVTVFDDDVVSVLSHVVSVLSHVNPRKAPGPDGLKGKVLKVCTTQLGSVLYACSIFYWILSLFRVYGNYPPLYLYLKRNATLMKDFRHVAVTSVLCICMERIVHCQLTTAVAGRVDPLQFAYIEGKGVVDATFTRLDAVSKHLDSTGNFVTIIFLSF